MSRIRAGGSIVLLVFVLFSKVGVFAVFASRTDRHPPALADADVPSASIAFQKPRTVALIGEFATAKSPHHIPTVCLSISAFDLTTATHFDPSHSGQGSSFRFRGAQGHSSIQI